MIELRHLRCFLAVAKHRHFTRAAEHVGIGQSALSLQIRALERELGVELFDRDNRRVSITAAGQALLSHAEQAVGAADAALAEMEGYAGSLKGRAVIGALQSLSALALPPILARFHVPHPDVEIFVREDSNEHMLGQLIDGELDMALLDVTSCDIPAGIIVQPLYRDELVVAVEPRHELATQRRVKLDALSAHPFIMYKMTSGIRRTVETACLSAGFKPKVAFESRDSWTICALVAEGCGITILPRSIAQAANRRIAAVPIDPPALQRTIGIAWRNARHLSGAAGALLSHLRAELDERPTNAIDARTARRSNAPPPRRRSRAAEPARRAR